MGIFNNHKLLFISCYLLLSFHLVRSERELSPESFLSSLSDDDHSLDPTDDESVSGPPAPASSQSEAPAPSPSDDDDDDDDDDDVPLRHVSFPPSMSEPPSKSTSPSESPSESQAPSKSISPSKSPSKSKSPPPKSTPHSESPSESEAPSKSISPSKSKSTSPSKSPSKSEPPSKSTSPSESPSEAPSPSPSPSPSESSSFHVDHNVEKICDSTDHPDLCLATVGPVLDKKKADVSSVLEVAVNASIKFARHALTLVKDFANKPGTPHDLVDVLNDCKDSFDDVLDNFEKAMKAFPNHDVGTVNIMLSAVITDVGDCEDAIAGVGSNIHDSLSKYADKLTNMTSNCLAIASLMN